MYKFFTFTKTLLILISCFLVQHAQAQDQYICRNGQVGFFSSTPIEDIKATNKKGASVLNIKTGALQFVVLIKNFEFRNSSMQAHFNEKEYMDSKQFPKAELKAFITDISKVNFNKDGTYQITVEGTLNMHGVTNKVKLPGTIKVKAGVINATAVFTIQLADYKIAVPTVVFYKVAEKVEVSVNFSYQPYQPKS